MNNNDRFNAIIPAARDCYFLLQFSLAISFDRKYPLFSSHIATDPSLRTLPTISLVNPFSFSQLLQALWPHIFGNWCLHGWLVHATADSFKIYLRSSQHPPYPKEITLSVETLSIGLNPHILLIGGSTPRNLASSVIASSNILQ